MRTHLELCVAFFETPVCPIDILCPLLLMPAGAFDAFSKLRPRRHKSQAHVGETTLLLTHLSPPPLLPLCAAFRRGRTTRGG